MKRAEIKNGENGRKNSKWIFRINSWSEYLRVNKPESPYITYLLSLNFYLMAILEVS